MSIKEKYNFSGIYQILNLVNGKRYIGQAQNIAKRIYEHHRTRNTGYLQKAVKKYGWSSFEISVIEKVPIKILNEREQFWINVFDSSNKKKGYNICKEAGTTRGRKHSDITIQKIKDHLPNRHGNNNPFYGKHHTIETRKRLSEIAKRRQFSDETKAKLKIARATNKAGFPQRPISQIDLKTGEIIKNWDNLKSVFIGLGMSRASISLCCHNKRRKAYGYGWEFTD